MQIYAEKNDVTITYEGGHQEITANREMINELINNLCANAIRYNKKNGSVKVRVDTHKANGISVWQIPESEFPKNTRSECSSASTE